MSKKDFSEINTGRERAGVSAMIDTAAKTAKRGRPCKAAEEKTAYTTKQTVRFTAENWRFIRAAAACADMSQTEILNRILEEYRGKTGGGPALSAVLDGKKLAEVLDSVKR